MGCDQAEEKAERRAARESMGRVAEPHEAGFLGGIPTALPALTRAQKLTAKAAKVGFDWPEAVQVVDKIHEELEEVKEASSSGDRRQDRGRDRRSSVLRHQPRPPFRDRSRDAPCGARTPSSSGASRPSKQLSNGRAGPSTRPPRRDGSSSGSRRRRPSASPARPHRTRASGNRLRKRGSLPATRRT